MVSKIHNIIKYDMVLLKMKRKICIMNKYTKVTKLKGRNGNPLLLKIDTPIEKG